MIRDYLNASAQTRRGRVRLAIFGLALVLGAWMIAAAAITIGAWGSLSKFSSPSLGTVGAVATEQALADARSDVRRVRYVLFPATLPGRALSAIPWIGRELQAPEQILRRAETDIEAARLLLGAIRAAVVELDDAADAVQSNGTGAASDSLRLAAESLDLPARQSLAMATEQPDVDYWFIISDRLQKRLEKVEAIFVPAASATVSGAITLGHIADTFDAGAGLGMATNVPVASRPSPDSLEKLADSLQLAFGSLDLTISQLGLVAEALGKDSKTVQEVNEFLGLSGRFAKAGGHTAELLKGFMECEAGLLEPECKIAGMLGSMQGPNGTLTLALEAMDHLSDTLAPELEAAGVPGADSLRDVGERLRSPASRVDDVVTVAYALLGAGGGSNVLILGVSPDELRPAGGFVSSAWTARFEDGSLSELNYIDVVEFDERVAPEQVGAAPESLRREMNAGGLYLRDVTWFPHLPDVGRRATGIAETAGRGSHDHVMVMTLWFVARLTEGLGGIVVDGELLDGDQVLKTIEDGTDAGGREFLAGLMPALLDRLSGSTVKEDPARLISVLREIMNEKDATFYSSDGGVQDAFERLGWGGALPAGTADRVAIFDSNIGWNKSDRHVEREFEYSVVIDPIAGSSASLSLMYSMPDLDDYICTAQANVLANAPYDELAARCNWNFVRGYIAYGSRQDSHVPMPALDDSVAVSNGTLKPGDDTFSFDFDENGTFFSGVLLIEPGEVSRLEVSYELPLHVIEDLGNGEFSYSLNLVAQPGAQGREGNVTVRLPEAATVLDANNGQVSGNVVTFQTDVLGDTNLTIRFGME